MTSTVGPTSRLRQLRRRLTLTFALVAVVAIAVFAVVLLLADTAARGRELDARLLGQASRASALVYVERGEVRTDAVSDDAVSRRDELAVYARSSGGGVRRLEVRSSRDRVDTAAVARTALRDGAERGTRRTIDTSDGRTVRVVALPWFDGMRIGGAVTVAAERPTVGSSPLLGPVLGGAALLVVVLVLAAALAVRRGVRPAQDAVAERDRFVAMAAHELRTPVARIRAGAEALERTIQVDREQAVALRTLIDIADGAGKVVGNLLLAARIEHGSVQVRRDSVRLDQLAADAEHLGPDVVVDVDDAVLVDGDPDLLRHVVDNLVQNALRHGRVEGRPLLVTVTAAIQGDHAVLSVSDDGAGLPDGLDVVRPFTGAGAGGSGLGLSIVAWIADQHSGRLTVHRDEPGTTVRLTLPAVSLRQG